VNGKPIPPADLTTPFRLANLPTSAKVEVVHQPLPKAAHAAAAAPASAPAAAPSASPAPPPTQPTLLEPVVVTAVAPMASPPTRAVEPPLPAVITEGVWPAPFKFPEASSGASCCSSSSAPTTGRAAPAASSASAAAAAAAEKTAAEEAMAALSPLERELGRALRVVLPEQREATDADGPQAMDESDDFYECANLERSVALGFVSGLSLRFQDHGREWRCLVCVKPLQLGPLRTSSSGSSFCTRDRSGKSSEKS
jgi:hypothetical protein